MRRYGTSSTDVGKVMCGQEIEELYPDMVTESRDTEDKWRVAGR